MSDPHDLRELEKDPRLFLFTSLTAGSSHIITATSRLETILKANRVPFQAIDVATDEKARRLWQRRAGKRKLPGLVKDGFVIGDLEEVEEWNEYGELKENIGTVPAAGPSMPAPKLPVVPTATAGTTKVTAPDPLLDMPKRVALPGAAEIAARNNPLPKPSPELAAKHETMTSAPAEKEKSVEKAIKFKGQEKHVEHLSAPPSAIPSVPSTPESAKIAAGASSSSKQASSADAGAQKAAEKAATIGVEGDAETSAKVTGDVEEEGAKDDVEDDTDTALKAVTNNLKDEIETSKKDESSIVPRKVAETKDAVTAAMVTDTDAKTSSSSEKLGPGSAAVAKDDDAESANLTSSVAQSAITAEPVKTKSEVAESVDEGEKLKSISTTITSSQQPSTVTEKDVPATSTSSWTADSSAEAAESTSSTTIQEKKEIPLRPAAETEATVVETTEDSKATAASKTSAEESTLKTEITQAAATPDKSTKTQKQAAAEPDLAAESVAD